MKNDSSKLPPLKSENRSLATVLSEPIKKGSVSSLLYSTYASQISPSHLLREVNNLTKRLDKNEKNVKELRSDVPQNIPKMLDKLESALKTIKFDSDFTIDTYEDDQQIQPSSYLAEQLEILESELRNDIKTKFSDFNQLLKGKVNHISFSIQNTNTKQDNQFDKHSLNVDNLLNDIQKKEHDKIDDLESKLNKLKKYTQPIENILSYSESINANSIQITELQRRLSLMSSEVDNKFRPKKNDSSSVFLTSGFMTNEQKSDDQKTDEKESYIKKYDYYNSQDSFDNILEDINRFKDYFNDILLSTCKKAQDCETKIMEVENLSNELKNSIQIIESKLEAEEILMQEISEKIEELENKSNDKTEYVSLQIVSEQIKSSNIVMKDIISSIKKKVKKCEMSVPLITFD